MMRGRGSPRGFRLLSARGNRRSIRDHRGCRVGAGPERASCYSQLLSTEIRRIVRAAKHLNATEDGALLGTVPDRAEYVDKDRQACSATQMPAVQPYLQDRRTSPASNRSAEHESATTFAGCRSQCNKGCPDVPGTVAPFAR